jgi:hypothetical protein
VAQLPGLVSYWRLDDTGGSLADSKGSNGGKPVHIALGKPGLLTGSSDTAIRLDGTTSYVDIADSPSVDLSGAFTLGASIEPAAVDGKRQVI